MATVSSRFSLFFCMSSYQLPSQNLGQCRTERTGIEKQSQTALLSSRPQWTSQLLSLLLFGSQGLPFTSKRPPCLSLSLTFSFPSSSHLALLPPAGFLAFYHSLPNMGCWSTPRSANCNNPSYLITIKDLQLHTPSRGPAPLLHTLFSCLQRLHTHALQLSDEAHFTWHQHHSKACQNSLQWSLSKRKKGKLVWAYTCLGL